MIAKKMGLVFPVLLAPTLASAQIISDLSLELVTSYSQSAESINVDGKSASFKTGGAGIKLSLHTDIIGSFYTVAGGGYLPKQSASFAGVELSGPATSLFYGAGYSYRVPIGNRMALSLVADYVSYDIDGDLDGEAFEMPVTADVESTVTMFDSSIAMHYAMTRDLTAVLGAGVKHWSLEATAEGELSGFTATTSVTANNTDPQFYIGAEFTISNVPVGVYYRRSKLSADRSTDLNGVDIRVLLMEF